MARAVETDNLFPEMEAAKFLVDDDIQAGWPILCEGKGWGHDGRVAHPLRRQRAGWPILCEGKGWGHDDRTEVTPQTDRFYAARSFSQRRMTARS